MSNRSHFDIVAASFVAVLLISNIASSAKIIDWQTSIFGLRLAFDAGTLLFPISYIFGDVLTEVYGYKAARRVIWLGFVWSALMAGIFALVQWMPGESEWLGYAGDDAYGAILGGVSSGGIIIASLCAYIVGELSNAKVMEVMKGWTGGKHLWTRTIGSTLIGQGFDTIIFICIASAFGVFPWSIALSLIIANYIFKVGIEVILTPMTYGVIKMLQRS